MNLPTTFAIAVASLTVAAYAEPETRVFIRHGMSELNIDADNDGWITRSEASAAADRMFAHLDRNSDGRLNGDDRPEHEEFDMMIGPGMHGPMPPGAPHVMGDENCTTTVDESPQEQRGDNNERRIERRITVICEGDEEGEAHAGEERREHRTVIIRRGDDEGHAHPEGAEAPMAAHPPLPPHPPMMVMMHGNNEEFDANHDGALSLEEFRTQHLRFFDASDGNGDGRVRFAPPVPPTPPVAPQPPQPPRR